MNTDLRAAFLRIVLTCSLACLFSSSVQSAPTGPIQVVCIGDSLTQGDGDDQGLGYPGRLQAELPKGSRVTNLGKSGWTSEMALKGYEGKPSQLSLALKQKPDLALIWLGSNDLWYLYEYANPNASQEKADLSRFEQNIAILITRLQAVHCRVGLALLDDQSRRPVAIRGRAFTGISPAELKQMSKQVAAYNAALKKLAAQHGCLLMDTAKSDVFTNPALLNEDGNHPNASGYARLTELWKKAIP
ncbi:SGNH/GDSL hydrolase family protein [bacterium]|nr:SGNH/GDSL hydrolase family protein [bacterium]